MFSIELERELSKLREEIQARWYWPHKWEDISELSAEEIQERERVLRHCNDRIQSAANTVEFLNRGCDNHGEYSSKEARVWMDRLYDLFKREMVNAELPEAKLFHIQAPSQHANP